MFSMTGYGRGDARGEAGLAVTVELRSVNNRFLDLNLRLPREYSGLEHRLRGMLSASFARGRIDAHVRRASGSGARRPVRHTVGPQQAEALLGAGHVPVVRIVDSVWCA